MTAKEAQNILELEAPFSVAALKSAHKNALVAWFPAQFMSDRAQLTKALEKTALIHEAYDVLLAHCEAEKAATPNPFVEEALKQAYGQTPATSSRVESQPYLAPASVEPLPREESASSTSPGMSAAAPEDLRFAAPEPEGNAPALASSADAVAVSPAPVANPFLHEIVPLKVSSEAPKVELRGKGTAPLESPAPAGTTTSAASPLPRTDSAITKVRPPKVIISPRLRGATVQPAVSGATMPVPLPQISTPLPAVPPLPAPAAAPVIGPLAPPEPTEEMVKAEAPAPRPVVARVPLLAPEPPAPVVEPEAKAPEPAPAPTAPAVIPTPVPPEPALVAEPEAKAPEPGPAPEPTASPAAEVPASPVPPIEPEARVPAPEPEPEPEPAPTPTPEPPAPVKAEAEAAALATAAPAAAVVVPAPIPGAEKAEAPEASPTLKAPEPVPVSAPTPDPGPQSVEKPEPPVAEIPPPPVPPVVPVSPEPASSAAPASAPAAVAEPVAVPSEPAHGVLAAIAEETSAVEQASHHALTAPVAIAPPAAHAPPANHAPAPIARPQPPASAHAKTKTDAEAEADDQPAGDHALVPALGDRYHPAEKEGSPNTDTTRHFPTRPFAPSSGTSPMRDEEKPAASPEKPAPDSVETPVGQAPRSLSVGQRILRFVLAVLCVGGVGYGIFFVSQTKIGQDPWGKEPGSGGPMDRLNHLVLEKLKRDAEDGIARAQFDLAKAYQNGKGVKESPEEALKWFQKAAEQGHMDAQYAVGDAYKNGRGVPQDNAEALKWYRMAEATREEQRGTRKEKGKEEEEDLRLQ